VGPAVLLGRLAQVSQEPPTPEAAAVVEPVELCRVVSEPAAAGQEAAAAAVALSTPQPVELEPTVP